jgi:hypothetical protein
MSFVPRQVGIASTRYGRCRLGPLGGQQAKATPGQHRRRSYEGVRHALVALWEASDRVCGNENTRVHAPGRVAVCMYADGAAGYGYKPDQAAPSLRGAPPPKGFEAPKRYQVFRSAKTRTPGIASDDVLQVRNGPSADHAAIGARCGWDQAPRAVRIGLVPHPTSRLSGWVNSFHLGPSP